jgi:hypothetical protein
MDRGLAIICIAATAVITVGAAWQLRQEVLTLRWHKATGRILEARVVEDHSGGEKVYYPKVRYSYSVNGIEYTSDRISFYDHGTGFRWDRKAVIEPYSNQTAVVVYFDPRNPENALLKRGISPIPFAVGAISMSGLVYAIIKFL